MARKILYPFARSGDRTDVPDVSSGGFVGYDIGYGFDYQRQLGVDPLFKVVDRKTFNQYMYDVTSNIQLWQNQGHNQWFASGALPGDDGYPQNAMVKYGQDLFLSLADGNKTEPTTNGNQWEKQWFAKDVVGTVPCPYQGTAAASGDFRASPYTSSGVWGFDSDAKVAAHNNAPPTARAGVLQVRANPGFIVQIFRDGAGSVFVQGYSPANGWSNWRIVVGVGQVVRADSTNVDSSVNWNNLNYPGLYAVSSFGGTNAPPTTVGASDFGLVEVVSYATTNVFAQVVTKYLDANNTEVWYRTYNNGTWSGWVQGDGRNKVNKVGDTMTGRLTMVGPNPSYLNTPEVYFQIPGMPNGMCIRGSTESGRVGSIQVVNAAYNAVLFEMYNDGTFVCNTNRPTWAGAVPWDTGNFNPATKLPVRPGNGNNGYVENLNSSNNQYFGWNGNWYYQVDGTYLGVVWTNYNFVPGNYASAYAWCQWQGDKSTEGPISNGGTGYEISGDRFLSGIGAATGESTANAIYMNGRTMRNN